MDMTSTTDSVGQLTLADVAARIEEATGLTPTQRRDLLSAISRVARLLHEKPDTILLDMPTIAERLTAVNPVAAGLSAKSFSNVRSGLLAAGRAVGLLEGPFGRSARTQLLIPEWKDFTARLMDKQLQIGLGRLVRWASWREIAPGQISDATYGEFVVDLRDNTLERAPHFFHRQTTKAWNLVVARYPDLALTPLAVPASRRRYTQIPWKELSEEFRNDTEQYLAWCRGGELFDKDARARPLAPGTVRGLRVKINCAATAYMKGGSESRCLASLADLVTAEGFRRILRYRYEAVGQRRDNRYNADLAFSLLQVATDWVDVDQATLAELKRLASKVCAQAAQSQDMMTEAHKDLLRQFDDPATLRRLVALPVQLWAKVKRARNVSRNRLAAAQAALAIGILLHMPIRLENLASLAFDVHVHLHDGPGAISTLTLAAKEVKNGVALEFDIPPHLVRMLVEYRDQVAPSVLGRRRTRAV